MKRKPGVIKMKEREEAIQFLKSRIKEIRQKPDVIPSNMPVWDKATKKVVELFSQIKELTERKENKINE
jgi:prefoldin subunit 5